MLLLLQASNPALPVVSAGFGAIGGPAQIKLLRVATIRAGRGPIMLSTKEKEELLTIARLTLVTYLKERRIPTFDPRSETLIKPGGAFVTLKEGENLRGCIGNFESPTPLYLTVQKMAILAATQDPRFFAVNARELPEIEIEISVISPRRGIERLSEIEVGKHGLSIEKEECRGVLLPQVATDNGWNREEFLSHTCMKAGLPPDAWEKGGLKIEVFTAEVFGEAKNEKLKAQN